LTQENFGKKNALIQAIALKPARKSKLTARFIEDKTHYN